MSDFESARAVSKGVSFASILAVEAEERNKKDSGSDILPWYSDKVVVETRDYQEATAEMVQHNKALQVAQCGANGVITELEARPLDYPTLYYPTGYHPTTGAEMDPKEDERVPHGRDNRSADDACGPRGSTPAVGASHTCHVSRHLQPGSCPCQSHRSRSCFASLLVINPTGTPVPFPSTQRCKVWAATRADLECRRAPSRPPLSATPLPPPANTPPMNM